MNILDFLILIGLVGLLVLARISMRYAVKNVGQKTEERKKEEKDKKEAIKTFKERCLKGGNLTDREIEELIGYQFISGAKTICEQIRAYYLRLKIDNPEKATEMLLDISPYLVKDKFFYEELEEIRLILGKYWSGYVLYTKGSWVESNQKRFIFQ